MPNSYLETCRLPGVERQSLSQGMPGGVIEILEFDTDSRRATSGL
ncbi:MAG: hypothetical protein AAC990_00125 [Dehalococcoides mccartyi]